MCLEEGGDVLDDRQRIAIWEQSTLRASELTRRDLLLVLERWRQSLQLRRGETRCPCHLLPARSRSG